MTVSVAAAAGGGEGSALAGAGGGGGREMRMQTATLMIEGTEAQVSSANGLSASSGFGTRLGFTLQFLHS